MKSSDDLWLPISERLLASTILNLKLGNETVTYLIATAAGHCIHQRFGIINERGIDL